MREHPDHPTVKKARELLDIPEEAEFLDAVIPKFVVLGPEDRKRDLMILEQTQKWDSDLRQEAQLSAARRRLREVDQRLRKVGL